MTRRDMVKTAGGVVIIGLIVAATFLYGNQQRQDQIQHDQQLKQQQQQAQTNTNKPAATSTAPKSTSSTPSVTTQPVVTAPSTTPQTGGEVRYAIPAAAMAILLQRRFSSRKAVRVALLNR